jgi:catechol 2,3-dioxygenase-like lactoylglutathione lyase family enzyme
MITGIAHTALHVPDLDAAVAWYRDVLGLRVLSPPYLMEGDAIAADMGELLPAPVAVRAAILGTSDDDDRVIEMLEYPHVVTEPSIEPAIRAPGFTHVGLCCDDVAATRARLERAGVRFLTSAIAKVAGLRTTWFADPWGNVFILFEKQHRPEEPYFRQY